MNNIVLEAFSSSFNNTVILSSSVPSSVTYLPNIDDVLTFIMSYDFIALGTVLFLILNAIPSTIAVLPIPALPTSIGDLSGVSKVRMVFSISLSLVLSG